MWLMRRLISLCWAQTPDCFVFLGCGSILLNKVVLIVTVYLTSLLKSTIHYANTSMQYTAIFHDCKNVNFQMKIYNIFLIFAQNIDCGYMLERPS